MTQLIIATRNRHKVAEIRQILGEGFEYRTLEDFADAPAVVEDQDSFAGNASKKAEELVRWLASRPAEDPAAAGEDRLVLADDSGLEVDALEGAPGVHSARYAALDDRRPGNSNDAENNAKLLARLVSVSEAERTARFRCVVALARMVERTVVMRLFEGACEGRIMSAPRGGQGFGYDPLFVPEGFKLSFAELGAEEKNRISHRARALAELRRWLDQAQLVSSRGTSGQSD